MRGIHMHNMFHSGTDFWGGTWIRRTSPFREAWVLTPLMAFLTPSDGKARIGISNENMHNVMQCIVADLYSSHWVVFTYPSVGLLMDTCVRYTPGESWPSTYRCSL
jgi:hypothetical protein